MQFFRLLIISTLVFLSTEEAKATSVSLEEIITTTEMGSCQTNNLTYSSMKFYKIPLNQKHEDFDLYLRLILFFDGKGNLSLRSTVQALLGCHTSSSGEEVCSFSPLKDQWAKLTYELTEQIFIPQIGIINFRDHSNVNRGFVLTFADDFPYPHLRAQEFIGGMIKVNFNQDGINTAKLCKN